MAATHAAVAFQASASNGAGSTTTGAWIDLTGAYGTILAAKIVNGATPPTVGCTVSIDTSPDNGTTIYPGAGGSVTAGLGANGIYTAEFDLTGVMYARTVFSGNTGQAVTVQADGMKTTGI